MKQKIIEILEKKGNELKGVPRQTMFNWKNDRHRMYVEHIEHILKENEIEEPFFWDGEMNSLIEFNISCGAKLGKKLTITIEQDE